MRDIIKMFKYPSMIKLSAFCAASFAFLLVIFKNGIVIVPEASEVRIANAVAIIYGIIFGPAGAVGCAVGNLVGDFGGSLTWLSVGGMLANFLSAYMPYRVWSLFSEVCDEKTARPSLSSRKLTMRLTLATLVAVVPCCAVLGVTFDIFGLYPAVNMFNVIFCNNIASTIVGVAFFLLLCKLDKGRVPWWKEIMKDDLSNGDSRKAKKRLAVIAIITALCLAFVLFYNVANGTRLAPNDSYGETVPLAVFVAYALASLFL